ncbi:glycine cleavage system protein GcvH [Acetoanaerobium sticklandii]|uniref:glycine cleavage system protein GcvH n=1 Tax=Acetoanaerobium sticklandii TaxID=1511 RepID=UPI003A8F150E
MNFPDNLKYSDKHLWVELDGNVATIGITDHAQSQLGELLYVEMPEIGDEISKDEDFGVAESSKIASDLIAPIDGEVLEINEALEDEPEAINEDPYANWIIKVKISDDSQVEGLMDVATYKAAL